MGGSGGLLVGRGVGEGGGGGMVGTSSSGIDERADR